MDLPYDMLFTLVYAVINGMIYAGYSAVAFEAVGLDAAATQFNAYASLANIPLLYMGLVDGWAYARFGASGMLYAEAFVGLTAIAVFFLASALSARPRPPATALAARRAG